jgi:two-component system, cell cycle sensor histidine kinase and response regulator CckA
VKAPLQILHLEDDPNDASLVEATLEAEGIDCWLTQVRTRVEFVAALTAGNIDLVLSDYSLPQFDGLSAAALVARQWPQIPLILVSGTLGEELAIDSLKGGATDYVLKGRLSRLAPAVRRAMKDVAAANDRRLLEAQVIEAQKMEVVGRLAAGVAHDFNNILGVIIGYNEIIESEVPGDSPLLKFTSEIGHASVRATALVRQLLVFSRKQTVQPVVLDVNVVLTDIASMLRRLIGEDITLEMAPGTGVGRVTADPGYLGQILMNLAVNARDAMRGGGLLTIETANTSLDQVQAREHGAPVGEYVRVSVIDTGVGMSDDTQAHLFEAFFTTKPPGEGTGLGLATCLTIAQQSGGHIRMQSDVGKGSRFDVYLPRVDAPLGAFDAPAVLGGQRGTETVLIVEDDGSVRQLAQHALQALGYQVLTATNGQDGLHVANAHRGAPIRLVVTDVVMPVMSGKLMSEWLAATYPGIQVLFVSGYTDDAIAHHGVLLPGVNFLAKPYTPASLARRVRELLDR